jgi:hypothetical protein
MVATHINGVGENGHYNPTSVIGSVELSPEQLLRVRQDAFAKVYGTQMAIGNNKSGHSL